MLRLYKKPYCALTYYTKDIENSVKIVDDAGIAFTEKPKDTDMIKRYVLQSPDELNISLVNIPDGFSQPPGPSMLTLPQQDYFNPEKYVNKTCGLYGEFAHPVKDFEHAISFWENLAL